MKRSIALLILFAGCHAGSPAYNGQTVSAESISMVVGQTAIVVPAIGFRYQDVASWSSSDCGVVALNPLSPQKDGVYILGISTGTALVSLFKNGEEIGTTTVMVN